MAFDLAPIAIFAYNRLWHLQQTLESLKKNQFAPESELYIFSDGPKNSRDKKEVEKVRHYIHSLSGFKSVNIIKRENNFGLANSIIIGVTEMFEHSDRVIVLEDDMVTSPYFLRYMNKMLEIYKDEERVISIHGYVYPIRGELPETFFLRGADCWGWATWRRGWQLFECDGKKLFNELKKQHLDHAFDFNGSFPYTKMLKDQIAGKNCSWAIRWSASAFINNKLTLYPGKSLVRNIGNDSSGTHCGKKTCYDVSVLEEWSDFGKIRAEEDTSARAEFEEYFRTISRQPSIFTRLLRFFR